MKQYFLIFLFVTGISTVAQLKYPSTKKVDQSDDYFGVSVSDPYRWLEDDNSNETKAWVDEQNKVTFAYLAQVPYRQKIKNRLTQIWNFEKQSAYNHKSGYYFFSYNNGLQNQSVIYYKKSLADEKKVLLDPNAIAADGLTSLSGWEISHDGKYLCYGLSKAGSDWVEIRVKEMETGKDLNDKIEWVKFSGMSWEKDGFYYSRYDAPGEGKALTQSNLFHKVYYHKVGTPQSADKLIYEDKEHGERNFNAFVTDDENFLIISGSESTSGNNVIIKDLKKAGSGFVTIVSGFENEFNFVDNIGNDLYFLVTNNAPKQKLIKINPDTPEETKWVTVIPEGKDLLEAVYFCGDKIISKYLVDVSSKLFIHDRNGKMEKEFPAPKLSKVEDFHCNMKESTAYYSVNTFTAPATVYSFDLTTGKSTPVFKPKTAFKSEQFETKQVFFTSKDGTRVPMFLTYKKGLKRDGKNPCFLYGYGGFNSFYSPTFNVTMSVFLEAGGIYAIANIRGGGEYGEEWHKAGTKCQKQNVFDDFIAAAEYLVKEKYTSHKKLAIHGRSNGGLLIGAVMTQRPDIAKVCLPGVGVLDMLRYHKFTIGRAWAVDYGLSENKEEFECLYKYSPLHNVKSTSYPATLVLTGDHDDRVVPAHSFKFAATLQENHIGNNPVLIRIDKNAGHGAGKPTAKLIDEWADIWAFVFYNLGMNF